MEYTLVSGTTEEELIRRVTELIESGWETEGGLAFSPDGRFYQAMVRFDSMDDEYASDQEL